MVERIWAENSYELWNWSPRVLKYLNITKQALSEERHIQVHIHTCDPKKSNAVDLNIITYLPYNKVLQKQY